MSNMRSKTVLITGCSSGFGRAMATLFHKNGWTVIATLRDSHRMKDEASPNDERFHVFELDVTKPQDREAAVNLIRAKFGGRLDCLINNAGYGFFGALEESNETEIRQQFEVNFFGLALLTRALLPVLRAAKGRVINISSLCGSQGMPLTSLYCASKFAVEGLTESLRYELTSHGVQVGMIEPGGFRTNFGTNVNWASGISPSLSPYANQNVNYRRLLEKIRSRPGRSPETVARTALQMAQASRMPLKIPVGKDAQAAHWARRLLPAFLWTRLAESMFQSVFNRVSS
jgi:NAD(P)-dependent dehydrogenase (short-subunit alcohol dehydrogenase family)